MCEFGDAGGLAIVVGVGTEVSVQIRGREDALVGATTRVALLVDHQYRGQRAGSERSDATRVAPIAAFSIPQI